MQQFEFRLRSIQKLRGSERQQRRQDLADAFRAERVLQNQVVELEEEIASLRLRSRAAVSPGLIDVNCLLENHRHEHLLITQIQLLRQKAAMVEQEIERRRQAVLEADRQLRVLEKLEQKQHAEFMQKMQNRQQIELEDTSTDHRKRNP